jgi:hypothetical protein
VNDESFVSALQARSIELCRRLQSGLRQGTMVSPSVESWFAWPERLLAQAGGQTVRGTGPADGAAEGRRREH